MKEVVKCENLWKIYNEGTRVEVQAIRGMNLEVKEKDFISLMGPSGSGKSTFMHLLGCLDTPTRGKIYVEGKDISKLSENELAKIRRKKIGFVFQTFNLIPSLSARENIELPMIFDGKNEEERKKRSDELLKKVGLKERANNKPPELSGGERQRVAIARALVNKPSLILADEPTGNLDSKTSKEIMEILNELNKEGATIIVITHDPKVAKFSKKTMHITDGKLEGG
jgi:putative ABC transport system ATP-binding protein